MRTRLIALLGLVLAGACQDTPTAPAAPPEDAAVAVSAAAVDSSAMISVGLNHACALRPNGAAYCWGDNAFGQLGDGSQTRNNNPVPVEGGVRFAQVSAGAYHTCALTAQGKAYCWGYNLHGRLGDGTTTNRGLPTPVLGGLTFTSISAGGTHTCARTTTASIYCWGRNDEGQLGNGTVAHQSRPIKVAGGISWTRVSAGAAFTCGKTGISAQVWCWGRNVEGQLGDGTTTSRVLPVQVTGGHAWMDVAAGKTHACGVDTSGKGWCWGANESGQLGTANTTPSLVPVSVYGTLTFASVTAGTTRTCALTPSSRGYCWGKYSTGPQSLGSPVLVDLDLGEGDRWCAVRADTRRWYCGELEFPVPLPLVGSVAVSPPAAGVRPGAVITFTAVPRDSAGNELEDRPVTWRSSDTTVVRVSSTGVATAVNVGTASVIATAGGVSGSALVTVSNNPVATVTVTPDSLFLNVTDTARLTAVLRDSAGQTVNRPVESWTSTDPGVAQVSSTGLVTGVATGVARIIALAEGKSDTSVVVVSLVTLDPASIATGQRFSCGLTPAGAAWCWGRNGYGQLGNPAANTTCVPGAPEQCSTVPVPVSGGLAFKQLTASWLHVCGLTAGGQAYCWGYNQAGQLGTGSQAGCAFSSTPCSAVPAPVAGGLTFIDIAAGRDHTCALTAGGETWCWGRNGTPYPSLSPALKSGVPAAAKLEAGGDQTCVLTAAGAAYCWGTADRVQTVPGGHAFAEVTVGGLHTCGITRRDGYAFCWGYNNQGQFGNGTTSSLSTPTPTAASGGLHFIAISAGASHTCGITLSHQAYCWGLNSTFQLGTGPSPTPASRLVPTQVAGGGSYATVAAGGTHTCAVTTGGGGRCWGENNLGQLGDGTSTTRNTPAVVAGGLTFDTD